MDRPLVMRMTLHHFCELGPVDSFWNWKIFKGFHKKLLEETKKREITRGGQRWGGTAGHGEQLVAGGSVRGRGTGSHQAEALQCRAGNTTWLLLVFPPLALSSRLLPHSMRTLGAPSWGMTMPSEGGHKPSRGSARGSQNVRQGRRRKGV